MEARRWQFALIAALYCSLGASQRTENFIVSAPTPQLANDVARAAEEYRRELAIEWLGHELPRWVQPCPIEVRAGRMGAGGATSFMFDQGRPFGWRMSVQGSPERILDSVLPHEVTHTIFATHFGRPLPRWADEGACTTVEHASEREKQHHMLIQFLTSAPSRGIPFNRMFAMTEYPADIMPLYSQGYSLVRYLMAQGGKRKFVDYIGAGMQNNDWEATTRQFYGVQDLSDLQLSWVAWVRDGYPSPGDQNGDSDVTLVSAENQQLNPASIRGGTDRGIAKAPYPDQSAANQIALNTDLPSGRKSLSGNSPSGKPSTGSWYARQSGKPQAIGEPTKIDREPFTPSVAATSVPGGSLARPQGLQSLQQPMVLQWQHAPASLQPVPRGTSAVPMRQLPLSAAGSVWR